MAASGMPRDRVRLDEVEQPVDSELSADAAQPEAAEWRAIVLCDRVVVVDPRGAGPQAPGETLRAVEVAGPDRRAEPRPIVVDGAHRRALVIEGEDRERRAELLLAHDPQVRRRIQHQ